MPRPSGLQVGSRAGPGSLKVAVDDPPATGKTFHTVRERPWASASRTPAMSRLESAENPRIPEASSGIRDTAPLSTDRRETVRGESYGTKATKRPSRETSPICSPAPEVSWRRSLPSGAMRQMWTPVASSRSNTITPPAALG